MPSLNSAAPSSNRSGSSIAILVMAHTEPELLDRLMTRLSASFDVYLHLDKAAPYSLSDFSWSSRVTPVTQRRTYWGAFAVTEAILDLLSTAHHHHYDHYVLISGQDVPLKSNSNITKFLSDNRDKDFIRTIKMPHPGIQGGMERLTRSYWHAFYRYSGLRRWGYQVVEFLFAAGYRTVLQEKILSGDFYHGETWFSLRHQTVEDLFSYLAQHPEYSRIFTHSRLAEEIFPHSVIRRLNSEARDIEDTTTFVDWDTGPESPRVLDETDAERLDARWELFARKVALPKSALLVDSLYERTDEQSSPR